MSPSIQIMLPLLKNPMDVMYYKGYIISTDLDNFTIYIVKTSEKINLISDNDENRARENSVIYGYCGQCFSVTREKIKSFKNFISLNSCINPQISNLIIDGKAMEIKDNLVLVFYDYNKMLKSEINWEYDDDKFCKLQCFVLMENSVSRNNSSNHSPFLKCPSWVLSSMFIQHVLNYINMIYWLFTTIRTEKKVSIRHGNLILAILLDIFLGYLALQLLTQDKQELSSLLMGILERLINMLYSLLKWLMGAPAGLKLNNAFNKMLGKYFSYHVQLWWLFLDVSGEKLVTILHIYHYLGYLGFTFQAAVISDMICIATFHSYCIYVYAARMFNIQISGLIALLRFFVGRKYNPLRESIDSCEYTNQELFVGTVAFTILLLLLPTTAMYYIVFTLFRVLSLTVQYALSKLIYHVHTLPLYAVILWLIHSPKVAGNILLEVISSKESSPLYLKFKLFRKSILFLIKHFRPPVDLPKQVEWTNVLSNVFIGKQII